MLPDSLTRELQICRLSFQVRRYGSRALHRAASRIESSADTGRIERLRREMALAYRSDPVSAAKYADRRYWLLLNIDRAARLNLHSSAALSVLDIGCGPGFFLAVARAMGHECQGVDVPESHFTAVERRVYSELLEALDCRRYVSPLLIDRFVPLPFEPGQFDLITAFWICFNRHRQPDEWSTGEWRFFVADARRCLRPGGRLFLELNENRDRYGDLVCYDAGTLEFFRSVGTVDGSRITIRN